MFICLHTSKVAKAIAVIRDTQHILEMQGSSGEDEATVLFFFLFFLFVKQQRISIHTI